MKRLKDNTDKKMKRVYPQTHPQKAKIELFYLCILKQMKETETFRKGKGP